MHVLVVNPPESALPEGAADMVRANGWRVTNAADYGEAADVVGGGQVDAVIFSEPPIPAAESRAWEPFHALVRVIEAKRVAGVLLTDGPSATSLGATSLIDPVDRATPLPELRGRLAMIARYHGVLRRMEGEIAHMERLGSKLNSHFREVEQEMRLAGRLQRDFLPKLDQPIGQVRFGAVFRPASWVSGDIFDVFRIDEHSTGFYVADAVGHGMAASLLTMFIKRAVVVKQKDADGERVLTPSETLAHLNDALTDQSLPHCQFVTACYGVIDHRTRGVRFARGGHPHPIHIGRDGSIRDVKVPGSLLGIFKGEAFPMGEVTLEPGEKFLLYTDGVELAFPGATPDATGLSPFHRTVRSLGAQPIESMLSQIDSRLTTETGSLNPTDDVTILALEIIA